MPRKSVLQRYQKKHWSRFAQYHRFQSQGFTLIEVMVALMVAAIFVSVTMQALVSAAFLRARAEQYDEAVNWIQEDLESIMSRAGQYEMQVTPYSTRCVAAPTPTADGLTAGFLNDTATGIGGGSATLGPKTFGGKAFSLTRTASLSPDNPYQLLRLTYTVSPQEQGSAVISITTEVLPYAVLKCP